MCAVLAHRRAKDRHGYLRVEHMYNFVDDITTLTAVRILDRVRYEGKLLFAFTLRRDARKKVSNLEQGPLVRH